MELLSARSTPHRRALTIGTALLLCLLPATQSRGQRSGPDNPNMRSGNRNAASQSFAEYEVKAEFLVRLTHPQFTTWPAGAIVDDDPVVIALIGADRLQGTLERAIQGRRQQFVIWRIESPEEVASGDPPEVLFAPSTAAKHYEEILAAVSGLPVLTIGEDQAFLEAGGLISLRIEGSRPVIEIARARAEDQGFRFSSELLRLAEIYPGGESGQ